MKKIGESQVIQSFSTFLQVELAIKFNGASYCFGNFSGSQDRKFADVFVGTKSSCILIEFKEFEKEVADEYKKPLRSKLCKELTSETAALSRAGHFIAFRKPGSQMEITIASYADTVCPGFSIGVPPLAAIEQFGHREFIGKFLGNAAGQDYPSFIKYVGHLNSTAGGTANGLAAPFKSVLYSKDDHGNVIGTIFESIGELTKILKLHPKTARGPKP